MDMMYLDEATEAWAKEGLPDEDAIKHVVVNKNFLSMCIPFVYF